MSERKDSSISVPLTSNRVDSSREDRDLPIHMAIIMDGNGRWAKDRGLARLQGHRSGTENIRNVTKSAINAGI